MEKMFQIHRSANHYMSSNITNWFHNFGTDDMTPALSVRYVADMFLDVLKTKGMTISIPEKQFRKALCEATCSLKLATLQNRILSDPLRTFPKPPKWNRDLEVLWNDWLNSRMLTYDFWISFWNRVRVSVWEDTLPTWRSTLQTILPFYIQRDTSFLVSEGLIVEEDDGVFVSIDDYESPSEYDTSYP